MSNRPKHPAATFRGVHWIPDQATLLATDDGGRQLAGWLVPYGEYGSTSLGRLKIAAGAIKIPDPTTRVKLLADHDRSAPIGRLTGVDDQPTGLYGTFTLGRTPEADHALLEASDQLRDGLSVELDDLRITGDTVTAATLRATALVAVPAYDTAVLTPAHPEQETRMEATPATLLATEPDDPTPEPDPPTPTPDPDPAPEQPSLFERRAPALLRATRPQPQRHGYTVRDVANLIAATNLGQVDRPTLLAVLSDVTYTDTAGTRPATWLNQLWDSTETTRPLVESLGKGEAITSASVSGWYYSTKPTVGNYTGDKADIPSNDPVVQVRTLPVQRIAGGHDVDRAHFDLGDGGYVAAHMAAMREDYAVKSETYAVTTVNTAANAVTPGGDGPVAAIMAVAMGVKPRPTFIVCAPDVFTALALTPEADKLANVGITVDLSGQSANTGGLTVKVSTDLAAGGVLGGNRSALSWHETSPLQVQAVDIARGGIDVALFGYCLAFLHDARGLAKATMTTAP
jgi:hypothetical protein